MESIGGFVLFLYVGFTGGYPWIAFTLSGFTHSEVTVTDNEAMPAPSRRHTACATQSVHNKDAKETEGRGELEGKPHR